MSTILQKVRNHAVVRKSRAAVNQVPKLVRRMGAKPDDYLTYPPVIVNSFPKSGTHLLKQIVQAFPGITDYGSFLASMPSISFRERTDSDTVRLVRRIAPQELVSAHLFYSPGLHAEMQRINAVHFFIYRDLRDVAISETHYLKYMNKFHRMHPYFKKLSDESGVRLSINGLSDSAIPYDYPNIAERFKRYAGWLDCKDVLAIRFEDLVSPDRQKIICRMAEFYANRAVCAADAVKLAKLAEANIAPQKSHTFREGKAGEWIKAFNAEHRSDMKRIAGELLIHLGYEQNLDW